MALRQKDLCAFPPMEIVYEHPTQGKYAVYSYRIKKEFEKHVHYACPADIPADKAREMTEAAKTVFRELGCSDLARVDFRMDGNGDPCFLEINPLPGLAPGYSDFPMAAEACGLGYDELIRRIAAVVERDLPELTLSSEQNARNWGSEDISVLMNRVQARGGLATYMRVMTPMAGAQHTVSFDFDEKVIGRGVEVFCTAVLDLMKGGAEQ